MHASLSTLVDLTKLLAYVSDMPRRLDSEESSDTSVLYVRDMPKETLARVKAAAALNHQSLAEYVRDLLAAHVGELEKKGILPKGK